MKNWKGNLETLEIKLKILTDTQTVENWKIFEKLETNIQNLKVSVHKYTLNMDTRCVIGISINLTLLIYLEKLERKSGEFQNKIKNFGRWKNLEKLEDI